MGRIAGRIGIIGDSAGSHRAPSAAPACLFSSVVPVPAHLVIPCFHEEQRLPPFLSELLDALAAAGFDGRVCVVDDGSGPASVAALEDALGAERRRHPGLLAPLLALPVNRGKGATVRAGWQQAPARADWLGFVDADGAVPAHEVVATWQHLGQLPATPPPALFAVRTGGRGTRVKRKLLREITGQAFRLAVRLRHAIPVADTQCGCKWLSVNAWHAIGQTWDEPGFAFDIDLSRRLLRAGAKIHSLPIDWHESPGSHLGPRAAARLLHRALTLPKLEMRA